MTQFREVRCRRTLRNITFVYRDLTSWILYCMLALHAKRKHNIRVLLRSYVVPMFVHIFLYTVLKLKLSITQLANANDAAA